MLIVFETEAHQKKAQEEGLNLSGLTPPTTNIVKRKFEKTKKRAAFPKEEVARVEEDLVKLMQGGVVEDIRTSIVESESALSQMTIEEELVEFQDWMVDATHPNGIVILDEMDYIKKHPEYLDVKITSAPIKVDPPGASSSNATKKS